MIKVCKKCGKEFTPKWSKAVYCSIACPKQKRSEKQIRLRSVWRGMLDRCYKEISPSYKYYGGKGIFVCQEWFDFDKFLIDMENGYSYGLMLDRIKNNLHYFKDNCRWVTPKESARNRTNNYLITINNECLSVAEWAEKLGIRGDTIIWRIKRGWTDEAALFTPLQPIGHTGASNCRAKLSEKDVSEIRLSTLKQYELAKKYSVHVATIGRIKRNEGWTNLPVKKSDK